MLLFLFNNLKNKQIQKKIIFKQISAKTSEGIQEALQEIQNKL